MTSATLALGGWHALSPVQPEGVSADLRSRVRKVLKEPLPVSASVLAVLTVVVGWQHPFVDAMDSGVSRAAPAVSGATAHRAAAPPHLDAVPPPKPVPTHSPRNPFQSRVTVGGGVVPPAYRPVPTPSKAPAAAPMTPPTAAPVPAPASVLPAKPEPASSAPSAPAHSAPAQSAPVHSAPAQSAPVHSAPAQSAPVDADGCLGTPGWQQRRGEHAVAGLSLPFGALGWKVVYTSARPGVLSLGDIPSKTVSVFVRPCAQESERLIRESLAFQAAQAIDLAHGSPAMHARWLAARGAAPDTPWRDDSRPAASGLDDFAEAYVAWQLGPVHWRSTVAPAPSQAQLQRLAQEFFLPLSH